MLRRFAMLALIWSCFGVAAAQTATPTVPAPVPAVAPVTVNVVITTSEGPITVALEKTRAPKTTANFLRYVDAKRFDGIAIYRAMKIGEGLGLIQGGAQNDPKRLFPPVAHEPTSETGLSNTDGAIAMARGAPGTATADFFIAVGDISTLDAQPGQPGDNLGYAAFGHVTSGMELVRRILVAPTAPDTGPPGMEGQMLAPPIKILTVRRAP
ncbi:MAG: peptidylprolyl isomerase [Sphingomonas bacterium]